MKIRCRHFWCDIMHGDIPCEHSLNIYPKRTYICVLSRLSYQLYICVFGITDFIGTPILFMQSRKSDVKSKVSPVVTLLLFFWLTFFCFFLLFKHSLLNFRILFNVLKKFLFLSFSRAVFVGLVTHNIEFPSLALWIVLQFVKMLLSN